VTHFLNLTFWDDFDAIKRFAGEDDGRARYYDFDPEYLIEMEPHVEHYERNLESGADLHHQPV
jgi:hypothetical protein